MLVSLKGQLMPVTALQRTMVETMFVQALQTMCLTVVLGTACGGIVVSVL